MLCAIEFTDAVTVDVNLNMKGVKGTISFSQQSPSVPTEIKVSELSGLDQYPSETFPWHIHNYPFTTQHDDPCGAASVGGHFDPFMASRSDYSIRCSNNASFCEVGDLSGKFGRFNASSLVTVTFTDNNLSLYGVHSIVGRSVVIHRSNGARWVCANIEYPSDVTVAYSPFRANMIGDIFFIEPYSPLNLTTVFVQLSYGSENSSLHRWYVHNNPIGSDGNCIDAGDDYNPRGITIGSSDYQYCSSSNQTACEVGDLGGKSSLLDFNNGLLMLFYTDINLPVRNNRLNETILGRSVVIHAKMSNPARIACANLLEYSPRIASVMFQEDGVIGQIVFEQLSPFSPTVVKIKLSGLSFKAEDYHVHEFPVDETIQGRSKCTAAGGHFNPTNITRNSSSPTTLDAYEIGDLSGKSSLVLTGINKLDYRYMDPYLPLFGTDSIVGRSIVIHDVNGDRWLCANILYDGMKIASIITTITNGTFQGRLVLSQLADDPFSETTIFLDFNFGPPVMSGSSTTMVSTSMTKTSNVTLSTSSLTSISITPMLSTTPTVLSSDVLSTSPNSTSTALATSTPLLTNMTKTSTESLSTSSSSLSTMTTVLPSSTSSSSPNLTSMVTMMSTSTHVTTSVTATSQSSTSTNANISSTSSTSKITVSSTNSANISSTSAIASTTSIVSSTMTANISSTSSIASSTSKITVTSTNINSTSSIASSTSKITVTSTNINSTSAVASSTSKVTVTSTKNANISSTSAIASTTSIVSSTMTANISSTSSIASSTSKITVTSTNINSTSSIASSTSKITVTSTNINSTSAVASSTSKVTVTSTKNANISSTSVIPSTSTEKSSPSSSNTSVPTMMTSTTFYVTTMGGMSAVTTVSTSPTPSNKPRDRRREKLHRRQAQTPAIYLSIQNNCEPGSSDVDYDSASSSCSPTNQLACSIGDLVGKHGPLSSGRNLLTDLNLPLTGPNSSEYMSISSSCLLFIFYY